MTLKEFKDTLERLGVQDNERIWYVDVQLLQSRPDDVFILRDERLGVAITT